MIINKILNYIFTTPSSISVLRVLEQSAVGLSGREIARLSGITHKTALKTLDNLEALKIVVKQIVGKTYQFSLNRKVYLYKEIISKILKKEKQFKQQIWNQLKKINDKNVISIIVFGSVARKEETFNSDLDLCIVYYKSKKEIENKVRVISKTLYEEYGVTLAPFYISKSKFRKKALNHEAPVNEILKDGIVISGSKINRIIHERKSSKKIL